MAASRLMAFVIFVSVLIVSCECRSAARVRKSFPSRAKECTEKDQREMSTQFNECINKYTQIHHENMGRAVSKEDSQRYTCQMLKDTVECGSLWKVCHTPAEVRTMKDSHIEARMSQFSDKSREDVDIEKCDVVKEYVESGRAEQIQQTTEGSCTQREVSSVQSTFQKCSHNLSTGVWDRIKDMQDSRRLEATKLSSRTVAEETNDILEEESRLDQVDEKSLVPEDELRPMLCDTLLEIGRKCVLSITKCFSREDINLMRDQHIHSMSDYYSSLYDNIDLSECEALATFSMDNVDQDTHSTDEESYDDYDDYEDEYPDEYDNYDDSEEQIPMPDPTIGTSTTARVTEAPTEPIVTESNSAPDLDYPSEISQEVGPSSAASEPEEPAHQKRDNPSHNQPSQLPVVDDVATASRSPSTHNPARLASVLLVSAAVHLLRFH